jgi:hypothetical protein
MISAIEVTSGDDSPTARSQSNREFVNVKENGGEREIRTPGHSGDSAPDKVRPRDRNQTVSSSMLKKMAESVRFELTVELPPRRFSRPQP